LLVSGFVVSGVCANAAVLETRSKATTKAKNEKVLQCIRFSFMQRSPIQRGGVSVMNSNVVEGKNGRNWQNLQVIEPVPTNRLSA
jgi:hypothetical protein